MRERIDREVFEALDGLLPPLWAGEAASVGLVATDHDYEDRYVGALLAGACGDALGRPGEGRSPSQIRQRYGRLTDFVPWRGYRSGPVGTITDDTQLTMCLAESIVERGEVDPEDLARRFVEWLPHGRGKGRATTQAVQALTRGEPWWITGSLSAGNGAAMRAAPIGLLHPLDPEKIRWDAALASIPTHADPTAIAAAAALAFGVAYCLHQTPASFDLGRFVGGIRTVLDDLRDPGVRERRRGAGPDRIRLVDQVVEALEMSDQPAHVAFDRFNNGALVVESVPAAFYCFAAFLDDPEEAIVTAANGGYDADTVAAMAGNLTGALHGATSLPGRWLDQLEYRTELTRLGRQLLDLSGLGTRSP
ncbi:MAG: ADP-ribosylglycohydrolase family protein [Acidimicrobiia bacterium]